MKKIDFATDPRVEEIGRRLPFKLYKYMRADDAQLEWLKRLLVDGELFFATPTRFNDPFDCAIAPSFAASQETIRNYVCDWYQRQGRNPAEHEDEIKEQVARSSTLDFRHEVKQRYLNLIQRYGIACFTAAPTNLLMWSYYAAGHTGVVIEVDTLTLMQQEFGAPLFPLDVRYAHEFPMVNYYTDDDFDIARKTLGTKADAWRHEEEWRWILVGKSGVVHLMPATITSVIVGLRTPAPTEQAIRECIGQRSIEIRRVRIRENSFVLETV